MRRSAWPVSLLVTLFLFSCFPSRPSVAPLPPAVQSVEGYASLRLTNEGKTAKSRLAFVFHVPDKGRVEVIDPLGRTASLLFLADDQAYLVLPRKRAYWKSDREEVMSKLLGFALSPEDLTHLLTGRADRLDDWALEKDGRGRVVRGRRTDLQFEIRQYFEPGPLPRLLVLSRGKTKGSLSILKLNFNQPLQADVFGLFFLNDTSYRSAGWEEVELWLREEGKG
ncbi:MAG: lipoprotein insertase outer membrane protein LolB [Candidatus Aminicenantales bacterium]